MRLLALM